MGPIRVVTISRQMASRGWEVAQEAARRLNFDIINRELINEAALKSGSPEAALAAIDELGLLGLCPSPQACKDYRNAVAEVMHGYAERGHVIIVGRAGQTILHNRPDTLHVRVIAPQETRLKRLMDIHGIPVEAAQAQIDASDQHRQRYMKRFYHIRWDDPLLYDLVINTGRLTVKEAAEVIVQAVRMPAAEGIRDEPGLLE